jgi:hypothetical protein
MRLARRCRVNMMKTKPTTKINIVCPSGDPFAADHPDGPVMYTLVTDFIRDHDTDNSPATPAETKKRCRVSIFEGVYTFVFSRFTSTRTAVEISVGTGAAQFPVIVAALDHCGRSVSRLYLQSLFCYTSKTERGLFRHESRLGSAYPGHGPVGLALVKWLAINTGAREVVLKDCWKGNYVDSEGESLISLSSSDYSAEFCFLKAQERTGNDYHDIDTTDPLGHKLLREYAAAKQDGMVDNVIRYGWYGRFGFTKNPDDVYHRVVPARMCGVYKQ